MVTISTVHDLNAYATRLTDLPAAKLEDNVQPRRPQRCLHQEQHIFVRVRRHRRASSPRWQAQVLNGTLDGLLRGASTVAATMRLWWSPDSSRVAFLQFDERAVPEYTLIDDIAYHPRSSAGTTESRRPNPSVRLGVLSTARTLRWSIPPSTKNGFLIVNAAGRPTAATSCIRFKTARRRLDLNRAGAETGASEPSSAKPDKRGLSDGRPRASIHLLKDGSFLWLSERRAGGILPPRRHRDALRQVTQGEWEIRRTHGVDPSGTWVYFTSTTHSAVGSNLYRVRLDGSNLQRVSSTTDASGVRQSHAHAVSRSWSDITTRRKSRPHTSTAMVVWSMRTMSGAQ